MFHICSFTRDDLSAGAITLRYFTDVSWFPECCENFSERRRRRRLFVGLLAESRIPAEYFIFCGILLYYSWIEGLWLKGKTKKLGALTQNVTRECWERDRHWGNERFRWWRSIFIALNTFRPQLMIPLLKFFMLKIKYRPNISRLINLAAEVCMLHMKTMKW